MPQGTLAVRFHVDIHHAPLLVIWETTRACALACRHCRAEAIDRRDPRELSTAEGCALIDQVAQMGTPLMVLTGGDPLQRDDLEALIRHGRTSGLRMCTIPAATPRLTRDRLCSLKDAGVDQLALSLDGPDAASHDDFRRVEGSYALTLQAAGWIRELNVPLQVNTVFGAWNAHRFEEMASLVTRLGAVFWEVFFLVPTGRGTELEGCRPADAERLFGSLYEMSRGTSMHIKVTEAPHYRRYVLQQEGVCPREGGPAYLSPADIPPPLRKHVGLGINSAKGFCFVDHTGQVCPSGFLPIAAGSVRDTPLAETYRHHPLFLALRDDTRLRGKCGACFYRSICGGSRARALAAGGDYLGEETLCAYEPALDACPRA